MRKRKAQLNFLSKEKKQKKKISLFITAFAVFLVLLSTLSIFLFMDSIDYNLKNIHQDNVTTTEPTSSTERIEVQDANVLLTIYDEKNHLSGLYLISMLKNENCIYVETLPLNAPIEDGTYASSFQDKGLAGMKRAIEKEKQIRIDRYIKQSETDLKKIVNKVGNVTVSVPDSIQYKNKEDSLYLEAGDQNLTGDLFLKYLHYAKALEQEKAVASLIEKTLTALDNATNSNLLNYLFNASDTDFSVVDNESNGLIQMFISLKSSVQSKG